MQSMIIISRKIYAKSHKKCVGFEAACFTCKNQIGSCFSTNVMNTELRNYSRILAVPLTWLYVYSVQNYI